MSKIPSFIPPMLCTLIKEPFSDKEWLFEVKWDGFRALAFVAKKVVLKSRNNIVFTQFAPIVKELQKIKEKVVLDGEIVLLDEEGKSQFQLMQNYKTNQVGTLAYYVFDILYLDGEDLRSLPLIKRKTILEKLLGKYKFSKVFYSDHILEEGKAFFKVIKKEKMEGIIGKKISSTYQSKRSRDWVKIKTTMRQEVVIGGFTEPKGSRKRFGSLLVGVYNKKKELVYVGSVGGGFDRATLEEVYKQLKPLIQDKCPFKQVPKANAKETWVKPKLLCVVSFLEWTSSNSMRHPVFVGMRMDKKPKEVVREVNEPR